MRLFIPVLIAVLIVAALAAAPVLADNGPHGGYTATTDACAGCHRAHTAAAANLLVSPVPNLCFTCHGSAGTGADTNVTDGLYLERDGTVESPVEGTANRGLKGGGFTNALMDTDWDLVVASAPVTSSHAYDATPGTMWGNGAIGSGAGQANVALTCVSCHDPHGNASTTGGPTYRLLRAIPVDSGAGSGVDVTDESTKTYSVSNADNQYFGENYGSRGAQLSNWCAQCHTRHAAPTGSGHTDSGDPIYAYRHTTTGFSIGCANCHVSHGTSATVGGYAQNVDWPDGTTPSGNERSSLLRVDNRGVCELCHAK
ncbi:MAG: cytochrome c3 family protein [Chloroflexi bacterium]|nr:cytochrome c3 family protein [Chloroflexota bacterium]